MPLAGPGKQRMGMLGAGDQRHPGTAGSSPSLRLTELARFFSFSSGGQLVSQMRALRCQGGFVTAPRAGPAALSCPPPPREPIVPGPSGGCWRQIYRGRHPAGRGPRSAAGRGTGAQPRGPLTRPAVSAGAAEGRGATYLSGFAPRGPFGVPASF